MLAFDFCVSTTHPSLEGHFPENPVVPGVVILEEIIQGFIQKKTGFKILKFPAIKFLAPLMPGNMVHVNMTQKKPDLYQFDCFIGEATIVSGQFMIGEVEKE